MTAGTFPTGEEEMATALAKRARELSLLQVRDHGISNS